MGNLYLIMSFACGGIYDTCAASGWTFLYTNTVSGEVEMNAYSLVNSMVDSATFLATIAVAKFSNKMSTNLQKALNALLCALKSGFINFYYLLEAVYYMAKFLQMTDLFIQGIELGYQYICTCQEDVVKIAEMLDIDPETLENYSKCAETDEDQCWYPVTASDGTVECSNCDMYYPNSDDSVCISCAVSEDTDGAGTMACGTECGANWTLDGSDNTVCVYDCTAVETDADGNDYCYCSD